MNSGDKSEEKRRPAAPDFASLLPELQATLLRMADLMAIRAADEYVNRLLATEEAELEAEKGKTEKGLGNDPAK